jgi:acyl-coenzyme A thioesterase PaaI-like protein
MSGTAAPDATFWQPRVTAQARRHRRLAAVPGPAELDLLMEEISPGHAVFSTHARVMGRDPGNLVNGGPCSTLLDFALSAAVQSNLSVGAGYRILEFRMVNVAPRRQYDGVMRAVGNVLHAGSRGVWAGGRVFDSDGAMLAVGSLIALVEADTL